MRQQISRPTEKPQKPSTQPLSEPGLVLPRRNILALLALLGLLLLIFTGTILRHVPQTIRDVASVKATATSQTSVPLQLPSGMNAKGLHIPGEPSVIYEQQNAVYRQPANGGEPRQIVTPGYVYSRAIPPLMTANGQLLYSGDGLWITDIAQGQPRHIATISSNDVITSMVLSSDKTLLAWSTEPKSGSGTTRIYAGSLSASSLVYQQDASHCPCLRAFSFLNNQTLLLTDDRGDHEAVQYDLWTLDITHRTGTSVSGPQPLLKSDTPQVPLALAPDGNSLLYSSHSGMVPLPTDNSAPDDVAALNYANSLSISPISKKPFTLGSSQVLLSAQKEQSNFAAYHWVMQPQFSPDGHTLVYIVFSGDGQPPFGRHSALYSVRLGSDGAGKPQVVATTSAHYIELGAWLNDHILTFYADGSLYALDIQSGAATTLAPLKAYSRIVAVTGQAM